jgi:hypothetical protein
VFTASGEQTQVFSTVLLRPDDAEHAIDPQTGRNFLWDVDKQTWVNSQTGESANFAGYLCSAPPTAEPGGLEPQDPTATPNQEPSKLQDPATTPDRMGPVVITEGQTLSTPRGEQAQVFSTVLLRQNDAEHAIDPQTGRDFHWDEDKRTWVNSQTGGSESFRGYLCTTPPVTATTDAARENKKVAVRTTSAPNEVLVVGIVTLTQVPAGQETSASLTTEPDKYRGIPALQVIKGQVLSSDLPDSAGASPGTASLNAIVVDMGDGRKQTGDKNLVTNVPLLADSVSFLVSLADRRVPPLMQATVPVQKMGTPSAEGLGATTTVPTNTAPSSTAPSGTTPKSTTPTSMTPGGTHARNTAPTKVASATLTNVPRGIPLVTMPTVMTAGGVQVMHGQTVGSSDEMKITVDNQPVRIVAAKPGTAFWDVPKSLSPGPHRVNVTPGPGIKPVTMTVYVLGLAMSADQSALFRGQSSEMRVTITGLENLPSSAWASAALPPSDLVDLAATSKRVADSHPPQAEERGTVVIILENRSPNTVRMGSRGDFIVLHLHRQDFAYGPYTYRDKLQSVQSGGFNIEGTVAAFLKAVEGQPLL